MALFRYRLQNLLDQKIEAKEEAQQVLAEAQGQLQTEQNELEARRREQESSADVLRRARAERVSPSIEASSGEWMRLRRDHIARLMDEYDAASDAMRAQELNVTETEERLLDARATLASRSRDVESLEKHRAKLERRFN